MRNEQIKPRNYRCAIERRLVRSRANGQPSPFQAPIKTRESHGSASEARPAGKDNKEHRKSVGCEAFSLRVSTIAKKVYYPALIDKDEDSDFGVSFPDFPGCVSAGVTLEEAILGAQEALAGHIALMLADKDTLPKPSSLDEIAAQKEASTIAITLVPVVLPGRARRVNVTLDEALLEEIDQITGNRSGFLAEAARAELARRRA